jgi:hypothetical protein
MIERDEQAVEVLDFFRFLKSAGIKYAVVMAFMPSVNVVGV